MATSDRPSGLTALAVLNVILAVIEGLKMLVLSAGWLFGKVVVQSGANMNEQQLAAVSDLQTLARLVLPIMGLWLILLLVSAVGYLKQRRWSWWVGNLYGVVGIAGIAVILAKTPEAMGGGKISLDQIASLFFPLFTLLLLNLVFRRDLAR